MCFFPMYSNTRRTLSPSLCEAGRVVRAGGPLALGLPLEGTLAQSARSYFYDHPSHLYGFTEVNADRLLRICGFVPEQLH